MKRKVKRKLNMKKVIATTLLLLMAFTFSGALISGIVPQLYEPPIVETSAVIMQEGRYSSGECCRRYHNRNSRD